MDKAQPNPKPPLEREQLMAYALRLLSHRDYAEAELRQRLSPRSAHPDDLEWVLQHLADARFVDEAALAERQAEKARHGRLVGKRLVQRELEARELDPETVRQAVDRVYEDTEEVVLARQHLEQKMSAAIHRGDLEEQRHLQRAYGRLRRAGFSHYASVRALQAHSQLAGNLDDMASDAEPD